MDPGRCPAPGVGRSQASPAEAEGFVSGITTLNEPRCHFAHFALVTLRKVRVAVGNTAGSVKTRNPSHYPGNAVTDKTVSDEPAFLSRAPLGFRR